jgi:hypothetical protein
MTTNLSHIALNQLKRAIQLKEKIEDLTAELNQVLGATDTSNSNPKRRGMSAAGRAAIRAAQKARWAKVRRKKPTRKGKQTMSAAGRARISAAAKLRWKAAKAAGKSRL